MTTSHDAAAGTVDADVGARSAGGADEGVGDRDLGARADGDRLVAATGANADRATRWIERLDAAIERLREHVDIDHPGRTDPVPGEEETWDAGQVWAHLAEFGDYWLDQLTALLNTSAESRRAVATGTPRTGGDATEAQPASAEVADLVEPPAFGRTRRDPGRIAAIEAGRHTPAAEHFATVEAAATRLRTLLAAMTDDDWACAGRHETLGVMDIDQQLQHFHVGHYEEHADQLDLIAADRADRRGAR